MYFSSTISSSVRVPVLSVHRISIWPNVWMALSLLTIVFSFDISTAPFAIVVVTITGSISGVIPTAIVIAKTMDDHRSSFVKRLMTSMMGSITSIKRMSSPLISSMPFSNEFFSLTETRDFAMFPKYVSSPVLSTIAVAEPETMFVPRKPMLGSSVMGSVPLLVVNFSTGLDSPVSEAWSTNVSLVS